jgi:hypothetical protein
MKDIRQRREAAPLGARLVPDIPSFSFANLRALITRMYDHRYGYPCTLPHAIFSCLFAEALL